MDLQRPIVLVVGTRPEGIKMAPVYYALKKAQAPVILLSTMQHDQLLNEVFQLFDITPDIDLGVMRIGQDLFYLTQSLLQKMKETFARIQPSLVVVQGDTTSTMSAALAAFYCKIPVAHIEAGLRTDDIHAPFPEEMNRRVVSVLARYHFAPTVQTAAYLIAEGIARDRVIVTGNTVVDALHMMQQNIKEHPDTISDWLDCIVQKSQRTSKYLFLLTMHRRESFDGGIERVLQTVARFLQEHPDTVCVYPIHPNPYVVNAVQAAGLSDLENCHVVDPLPYPDLVYLLDNVSFVLTDSGGIQEEAISLGKRVLVLREKTERQEGIWHGLAHLVGTDADRLYQAMMQVYEQPRLSHPSMIYGDGTAAEKIVQHLMSVKMDQAKKVNKGDVIQVAKRIEHKGDGMKVNVLGLGYIGLPTAIVLTEAGCDVVGVDVDAQRVAAINNGDPVIQEPDLFEKLTIALQAGTFKASTDVAVADYHIIAVPTPFTNDKQADLSYVFKAADMLAPVLAKGATVILESTVPVGATDKLATYLEQKTGLVVGGDIAIAHCPERVLPGQIFRELVENDRIIGGVHQSCVYQAKKLYDKFVKGAIYLTDSKTAEMVKLIENSSRDAQIAFAHQVASMAYNVGIDPYEVIALANKHPRVNILKPSCGVGGHCIAVDPWFLIEGFTEQTKLLSAARQINDSRPLEVLEYVYKAVRQWYATHKRACTVLLMGLTYKPDVDDLRESPAVRIADMVREHEAINMFVCEPHIKQEKLNVLYPDAAINMNDGLQKADIVVFLVAHTRFGAIDKKILQNKIVLDFCGVLHVPKGKDHQLYWPAQALSFFMPTVDTFKESPSKQEML